jgi:DNA polymerase-1
LAALSEDEELTAAFKRGDDLHRLTAARVLGIAPEAVGEKDRRLAKTLNFGLMYGMGARAFAQTSGVSAEEAKKFIAQYFKTFSKVKKWQESVKGQAATEGFVETLTGRRRYLPGAISPLPYVRAEAERAAVNFPIQGLGADLIKLSMVRIREFLRAEGWENEAALLLSIHDELLFEMSDAMIQTIAPRVRGIMESAYPLNVPLTVKISTGKDWGNLLPWT